MNTATARLYETDFYGWIQNQAAALKAGNLAKLDLNNLIEEIEDMGKSQRRELESRLETLLMHLLKWRFQPLRKTPSWTYTIREQRKRIADHLRKNPSLKSILSEACSAAYGYAVMRASEETGIAETTFPAHCPWTFEQATDPDFWPDPV